MLATRFLNTGYRVEILNPRKKGNDLKINESKVEMKTCNAIPVIDVSHLIGLKNETVMSLISSIRDHSKTGFNQVNDGTLYLTFWCPYLNVILYEYLKDCFKNINSYSFPEIQNDNLILVTGGISTDQLEQYTIIPHRNLEAFLEQFQNLLLRERILFDRESSLPLMPQDFEIQTNCTKWIDLGAKMLFHT